MHLHVHTGGAEVGTSADDLAELRAELVAALVLLHGRADALQAQIDVVARKLHVAVEGDHRRRLRAGGPPVDG